MIDSNQDKFKKLFIFTLLIAILLLILILYMIAVRPSIDGYIINKQLEAKDIVLLTLISQIQEQGFAQINLGNQSLILVPVTQEQLQQLQQNQGG